MENRQHTFLQYQFENIQKNLTYYANEDYQWDMEKGHAKATVSVSTF